ncbi:unnamed protein product [Caenorhabditis angaria]|uniref:Uncharacterized protein n=1 Tax=Caenorhabditis angaria TaxID=860376 RepID=A0A9P1IGV1_9PELO|nr:unnamed protein product [Caenorhabditis angaria]
MSNCSSSFETLSQLSLKIALIFNLTLIIISIILCLIAIYKLITISIFQFSTRVFLSINLTFVIYHQSAFVAIRVHTLYSLYYGVCDIQLSECIHIMRGVLIGSSGIAYIQVAMTLDRIFSVVFKKKYKKYGMFMGTILIVISVTLAIFTYSFIIGENPLTKKVDNCGALPAESFERYGKTISWIFYLSIIDLIMDMFVLRINIKNEKKQRDIYNVRKRYASRITLKSIQAIITISIVHFISQFLYSVMFFITITFVEDFMSYVSYLMAIIAYPVFYTSILNASLIIHLINRLRKQRVENIRKLTSQKHTFDDYMQTMRAAWK